MECEYILKLENINKSFSGVSVLKDVNLNLKKGKILGLVGENGAGKSTLMNILGGIVKKDSGEIILDNEKYDPKDPIEAEKYGIAFIHQELNLFTNLTVMENIFIENLPKNSFTRFIKYKTIKEKAAALMKRFNEDIKVTAVVEELNMGCRQMVEIAKAVNKKGKIIIFDEPTTSLSQNEKSKLFEVIQELRSQGVSIIYISHILEDVFTLCDDIVILRDGKSIESGNISAFTKESVITKMVGRELTKLFPYLEKKPGEPGLEVKNIVQAGCLNGISFTVRCGEIVGLYGLMGAGRSELARAIFGLDSYDNGEIIVCGKKMTEHTPVESIKNGMAFITEDRKKEGLLLPKSVKDNVVLASLDKLSMKMNALNRKEEEKRSEQIIQEVKIKTYDKNEQHTKQLSGGNQQKVIIAKWLLLNPKVFILDEPTRGIDVGSKYEIYNYINNLAQNGSSILFISSEMEELIGICDRIMIMNQGRLTGEIDRATFDQEVLLKYSIM